MWRCVLKCWDGRATDKCITMNSDFITLLEYGDVVLADCGFDIANDIAVHGASLIIPSSQGARSNLACKRLTVLNKLPRSEYMLSRS